MTVCQTHLDQTKLLAYMLKMLMKQSLQRSHKLLFYHHIHWLFVCCAV